MNHGPQSNRVLEEPCIREDYWKPEHPHFNGECECSEVVDLDRRPPWWTIVVAFAIGLTLAIWLVQ